MTSLIQYEPSVDRIIRAFLSQTEKLYASTPGKSGNECDFAKWLQYYAFDVIGAITYSKAHGFVDRNEDVDGMVKYLAGFFDYIAVVCWRGVGNRINANGCAGWTNSHPRQTPSKESNCTVCQQTRFSFEQRFWYSQVRKSKNG